MQSMLQRSIGLWDPDDTGFLREVSVINEVDDPGVSGILEFVDETDERLEFLELIGEESDVGEGSIEGGTFDGPVTGDPDRSMVTFEKLLIVIDGVVRSFR